MKKPISAWDSDSAPDPLPMPLQNVLVAEAHQRMSNSLDPTTVGPPTFDGTHGLIIVGTERAVFYAVAPF